MPYIDPAEVELATIEAAVDFAGRRVLEIGAGDGRLAWPFAPQAALWLALDPDAEEVRRAAEEQHSQRLPALHLLVADGRALCLAPESFDIALFTWSLC